MSGAFALEGEGLPHRGEGGAGGQPRILPIEFGRAAGPRLRHAPAVREGTLAQLAVDALLLPLDQCGAIVVVAAAAAGRGDGGGGGGGGGCGGRCARWKLVLPRSDAAWAVPG